MGFQDAQSDSSYIGLNIYSLTIQAQRLYETISNQNLIENLMQTLPIVFHYILTYLIQFASRNQLGIYFSKNKIDTNTNIHLPFQPQIIVSPSNYITEKEKWLSHCDSVPLDTPTSLSKNSLLSKLKAYPNPVKEQFTLENNSSKKLSFQLYNTVGSQVKVGIQQNQNNYQFSMGHLPKGIYLLQIIAGGERGVMKLIKD